MVNFKQLLEKATSGDLSEPDWETILEIVEEVKTKNVSAKNAIKEFRKRLLDTTGNAVYHTLLALDSLMKNCASDVHSEVLTVEFMGIIKTVITTSKDGKSEKAVDKALELIGEWKTAFGDQSTYKAINTVFSELERDGYHIPQAQVSSAAFIKKAPDWMLQDRCFMCRQEFNRFKGKLRHHCRNCGKSVCAQCSGKRVALPHFGVEERTRVCDICYKKVEKGEGASAASAAADMDNDLPPEYLRSSLAQESQAPSSSSGAAQQMREDDDLQLAIAMSLNEQENKPKKKTSPAPAVHFAPSSASTSRSVTPSAPPPPSSTLYASIAHDHSDPTPSSYSYDPPPASHSEPPTSEPSNDPLARYLDRSYWEQRKEQQTGKTSTSAVGPSATQQPAAVAQPVSTGASGSPLAESVRKSIAMFVKRLHDVSATGASIATDPVILSLYQNLTAMQPQLLKQIDEIQQQKTEQKDIINKLNEAKEARVTLNKMRRDHQDKVKQMEQEQAMLARMQMEQKLALLRQQKQEQLVYQQSLQNKRLEVLNSQRLEYEQKISMQRELERQQLIAKEQKVLQHQFGGSVTGGPQAIGGSTGLQQQPYGGPGAPQPGYAGSTGPQQSYGVSGGQQQVYGGVQQGMPQQPPGAPGGQQQPYGATGGQQQYGGSPQPTRKFDPALTTPSQFSPQSLPPPSLSMDPSLPPLQSMTLHDPNQALPLPSKVEYNPSTAPAVDPLTAPPPYNPSALDPQGANVYASYQVLPPIASVPQQQPVSYQQPDATYQAPPPPPQQQPTFQAPLPAQQPVSYQAPQPTVAPGTFQTTQPSSTTYQPPLQSGQFYQDPVSMQPASMQPMSGVQGMEQQGAPLTQYGSSSTIPSQPSSTGMPPQGSYSAAPAPPPQVPPASYQVYPSQFPQQQQQTVGTFVPNGTQPQGMQVGRKDTEPPLISFD